MIRNPNGNKYVCCHFNILEILVKLAVPNNILFNEDEAVKDHRIPRTHRASI